ncbi:glyoxalase III HchA [Enterovibrio norvegicus]|uniref:glyoxalase III HchA n=1 Tax=Enterovibrio norvegicus TaxID=188144 RepID=UPI000C826B97|nr:glyoxalase III HchA [Enterovibrio norvegicus]PML77327.1 protein deglycase HchA [Enterovibrio norvegicus]
MLKKLFGLAPKRESDGSYSPSKLALKLATSDKTDYESVTYRQYQGNRSKVLVIFTEQKNMQMQNGKKFSTGNHPVEALLPMLHLKNAGFDFDIVTPTGKPVIFEMWAFPNKDDNVVAFFDEYKSRFEQPGSLADFVNTSFSESDAYAAVFIPGGHGAMLGIPEDINVGKALHWANDNGLFTITLCHGPGALLATSLEGNEFLYAGYKMAVFPDSVDDVTPKIGYLPGKMPWGLSKKLESLGVTLMNTKSDKTVCLDRQLITGASPMAADALGKLAANTLLDSLK